jgi:metal-responsive CopG/Arc/MetJ family transcriptional regulator
MLRTQISLTQDQRRALDAASARTGRSMSELVRLAVDAMFLTDQSRDDDVRAIRAAAGAWSDREGEDAVNGATYVDRLRSGRRLRHR